MTPERLAFLRHFVKASPIAAKSAYLVEALDEIDRLNALIATRPSRHRIRLNVNEWHCAHPIDCNPLTCGVATSEIASTLFDEHGADVTVELTDDGWEVLL